MYPGLMRNDLILREGLGVTCAPAVPYTSNIISGNDLDEAAGLDVSDFDESAVEKEDVRRVPGNPLCRAVPFDRTYVTDWVSMLVDVKSELYGDY